jgi:asparagine synthase (glutamine-hydrolysing)
LARDRLGVKPLYWARHDGAFYFASEAKALLCALPRPSLRRDAVADYLTFLWVPDPETLFEGIYKLPAGHFATFDGRDFSVREYWDMRFEPEGRPADQLADEVRAEVDASVRRQMVSDVPLGSFLSGGIDSSAIVASMAAAGDAVTTYTIGFERISVMTSCRTT